MTVRTALLVAALTAAGPPALTAQTRSLRDDVDALHAAMVAAFKKDPASVATFYTDDASILGGGGRHAGRAQIDQYWSQGTMFADWSLEIIEVGGDGQAPWVRGRSTLLGRSGRRMVTEYIGLLRRQPDGRLKFYVDMFVAASPGTVRAPEHDR